MKFALKKCRRGLELLAGIQFLLVTRASTKNKTIELFNYQLDPHHQHQAPAITYQKRIRSPPATPLKHPRTKIKPTVVSTFPSILFLKQKIFGLMLLFVIPGH